MTEIFQVIAEYFQMTIEYFFGLVELVQAINSEKAILYFFALWMACLMLSMVLARFIRFSDKKTDVIFANALYLISVGMLIVFLAILIIPWKAINLDYNMIAMQSEIENRLDESKTVDITRYRYMTDEKLISAYMNALSEKNNMIQTLNHYKEPKKD